MIRSSINASVRGKTDPAWEHFAHRKEGKTNFYTCIHCGMTSKGGGVNRMKQHLEGITGQIGSCKKVPHDVRHRMLELLKVIRERRESAYIDKGKRTRKRTREFEILSEDVENSIPASLVLPEEDPGNCEKPLPEDECDVSKEMSGVNVAYGSGGNRPSARLHNIKVCQQKQQPATGSPPKHPHKDQSSTSAALENCDGGPESPLTPIHSQPKGLPNTLSEQLVKKSASGISRTSSAKTEGCCKKKKMVVKTETTTPKRKMSKPASSVKSPQERDVNHSKKGSKQKTSLVSPESLSLKKSRSGRLLLPPLEFWRNQIPIYNADREVTEIQEGASLASSCRGSPASLGRFSNQKDRNAQHDARQ